MPAFQSLKDALEASNSTGHRARRLSAPTVTAGDRAQADTGAVQPQRRKPRRMSDTTAEAPIREGRPHFVAEPDQALRRRPRRSTVLARRQQPQSTLSTQEPTAPIISRDDRSLVIAEPAQPQRRRSRRTTILDRQQQAQRVLITQEPTIPTITRDVRHLVVSEPSIPAPAHLANAHSQHVEVRQTIIPAVPSLPEIGIHIDSHSEHSLRTVTSPHLLTRNPADVVEKSDDSDVIPVVGANTSPMKRLLAAYGQLAALVIPNTHKPVQELVSTNTARQTESDSAPSSIPQDAKLSFALPDVIEHSPVAIVGSAALPSSIPLDARLGFALPDVTETSPVAIVGSAALPSSIPDQLRMCVMGFDSTDEAEAAVGTTGLPASPEPRTPVTLPRVYPKPGRPWSADSNVPRPNSGSTAETSETPRGLPFPISQSPETPAAAAVIRPVTTLAPKSKTKAEPVAYNTTFDSYKDNFLELMLQTPLAAYEQIALQRIQNIYSAESYSELYQAVKSAEALIFFHKASCLAAKHWLNLFSTFCKDYAKMNQDVQTRKFRVN